MGLLGIELRTMFLNFTTIQWWTNLKSSFFWDMFGGLQEKERVLRGEERKMNLRGRWDIVSVKTDLTLFITRVLRTYYLFYYFIKTNSILFINNKLFKINLRKNGMLQYPLRSFPNFPYISKFKSYSIQLLCFFLNLGGVHHFQKLNYQTNIPISKPNQTLLD